MRKFLSRSERSLTTFNMARIASEKMVGLRRSVRAAGPTLDNVPVAAD